jgi:uncharacterized protein (TIGR02246 family)
MSVLSEIEEVFARYLHAHDARDAEGVAACFASDCHRHHRFYGREQVKGFYKSIYETNVYRRRHLCTNFFLDSQSEDSAVVKAQAVLFLTKDEKPEPHCTGVYTIEMRKENGSWLIHTLGDELDNAYSPGDMPEDYTGPQRPDLAHS